MLGYIDKFTVCTYIYILACISKFNYILVDSHSKHLERLIVNPGCESSQILHTQQ